MKKNAIKKPFQIVIFGATGDLAALKLFPAVYDLFAQGLTPANFDIVGYGRSAVSDKDFVEMFKKAAQKSTSYSAKKFTEFARHLSYFQGSYNEPDSFIALQTKLSARSDKATVDQVFYYSVPPMVFADITENLSLAFHKQKQNIKVIIEKPFGLDQHSANELFKTIQKHFDEEQIYLMDHFLGKKPIQSIFDLRLENSIINLMLKGAEISNIQITAFEKRDVGTRVGYFEQVGIMKDIIQSHLLQILTLITMDIPLIPAQASVRREKFNILSAIRFSGKKTDALFGQYKSYRSTEGVPKKSNTDTFCAIKLFIDRREWFNVPIFIRTGKMLNDEKTQVVIEFEKMPFQDASVAANKLIFTTKPDESMEIFLVKAADSCDEYVSCNVHPVRFVQPVLCEGDHCLSDYGNLILDVLHGRKKYFLSFDEISASWRIIDEIDKHRKQNAHEMVIYDDHSGGPEEQHKMTASVNLKWHV